MKIYLFRHAEKSAHFQPNPGLSERGAAQALLLAEKVGQSELPRPTQLWVSPKKRAQQSFAPLAEKIEIPLKIVAELDERTHEENRPQFHERIRQVIATLEKEADQKNQVIYLCSHSDWLEEALALIPADTDLTQYWQWSTLQYLGLNYKNHTFEFIEHKRISP